MKTVSPPWFLTGGGSTGALMRAHDWSKSPLGHPESWPQSLRTVVALLLQSQFPMFVAWGESLGFLYNDSYAEILGAKHPRSLGARFHDIWSEIWTDISPLIDEAMAGRASYREDLPLVMNRKGFDEKTWFTFSYSPVRDESGTVAGMFCAVSETTQKVVAERELRELNDHLERRVAEALDEKRLFAGITEGTNLYVQVVDLNYRWLAINNAAVTEFEKIFGKRPKVGDSMLELLADQPDNLAAVKEVWSRALAGEEFAALGEFGDPKRARHHYEMRFNTLRDSKGKRIGAYQFVHDVTEQQRSKERLHLAEEALRQAQKMESIGQLTGGVAHDFNNLLAVFANGLQLLERNVSGEQRRRVLDGMRRAVARGSGLTHHLLAFSRRRPVNPESIDLRAHLAGMREMLDRSLGGDIRIEMKLSSDLWPVEVDPGEIEVAILNLCVNARDAMSGGGMIVIAAENLQEVHESGTREDFVKLSIADAGSGMSPEVQARAFEPFFTTKDIGRGSGLGLAQVYGFAQQSGGRVTILSHVGVGTIVSLLLPRSEVEPVSPSAAVDVANDKTLHGGASRRGTVLLVEDDKEVAALTRELLTSLGFSVMHVESPVAALGALADGRAIDVVLSDIMMPGGVSGVKLAHEINRRKPSLKVVLTTGYAESAASIMDKKFNLLLKPYSVESLAEALGVDSA